MKKSLRPSGVRSAPGGTSVCVRCDPGSGAVCGTGGSLCKATRGSRSGVLQWVVVLVVGVLVVTVVLGLNLIPRLSDGQKVLDAARPAFTPERVAGARAGINIISKDVDMADPIGTARGTGAAEVPKLIAFVSQQTGLSQAEVLAALQKNFPHTTALLQTIPLSVGDGGAARPARLPRDRRFMCRRPQLLAALKTNFPATHTGDHQSADA